MKSAIRSISIVFATLCLAIVLVGCSSNLTSSEVNIQKHLDSGQSDDGAMALCQKWHKMSGDSMSKVSVAVSANMLKAKDLLISHGGDASKDPNFNQVSKDTYVALCKLSGQVGIPGKKNLVVYVGKNGYLTGLVYSD